MGEFSKNKLIKCTTPPFVSGFGEKECSPGVSTIETVKIYPSGKVYDSNDVLIGVCDLTDVNMNEDNNLDILLEGLKTGTLSIKSIDA